MHRDRVEPGFLCSGNSPGRKDCLPGAQEWAGLQVAFGGECFPAGWVPPVLTEPALKCAPPHPRVRPGDVESSMRNQVLQSGRPGGHLQNTASLSPGHRLPCCLPPPVTPPDGLTLCSSLPPTLRWLLTRKSSILRWPPVNSNESSLIGWGTRSCPPPRAPTPPGNYI